MSKITVVVKFIAPTPSTSKKISQTGWVEFRRFLLRAKNFSDGFQGFEFDGGNKLNNYGNAHYYFKIWSKGVGIRKKIKNKCSLTSNSTSFSCKYFNKLSNFIF